LFQSLYSILSKEEEEQENYWMKLNNKEAFWNEFKDDGKHKLHCIAELALLFVHIFGRMVLTVGLENAKKLLKLLGMLYD
jgi:hypothetical protein